MKKTFATLEEALEYLEAVRNAARALREYGGDGWSLIFDRMSGERIIRGRTA